jgi:hypothetical protein
MSYSKEVKNERNEALSAADVGRTIGGVTVAVQQFIYMYVFISIDSIQTHLLVRERPMILQ